MSKITTKRQNDSAQAELGTKTVLLDYGRNQKITPEDLKATATSKTGMYSNTASNENDVTYRYSSRNDVWELCAQDYLVTLDWVEVTISIELKTPTFHESIEDFEDNESFSVTH